METDRFTEALTVRANDRRRGTSFEEKDWKNGYVDGASSILSEVDALIKKYKDDALVFLKRYIKGYEVQETEVKKNEKEGTEEQEHTKEV
jgi:hypothetical protein